MDTLQTQSITQNQVTKRLFKDLFLIQLQLGKYQDSGIDQHAEVMEIIDSIDRLMETLLE